MWEGFWTAVEVTVVVKESRDGDVVADVQQYCRSAVAGLSQRLQTLVDCVLQQFCCLHAAPVVTCSREE